MTEKLLGYASPSVVGRMTKQQWESAELVYGALPMEYKEIISLLGYGSFGVAGLFHPQAKSELDNLQRARDFYWHTLELSFPAALQVLRTPSALFGHGPERHVIAWVDSWLHLDFEMETVVEIGPSLSGFLISEYVAAILSPAKNGMGNCIWATGGPGAPLPFFRPATHFYEDGN